MKHCYALPAKDSRNQHSPVAVRRIFLAAKQRNAELLYFFQEFSDTMPESRGLRKLLIEDIALGIVEFCLLRFSTEYITIEIVFHALNP